jgi:O-antigen/teichoic acid export membrane protein
MKKIQISTKSQRASNENQPLGLGNAILKGSAWMIGMRWASRFMGLASMVVVARLLSPADFGIFAVATALIGLMDALTDIGTDLAIIRHPNPQRCHYDTAWTFKIILHSASALLIILAAPLATHFYEDIRYESILQVFALCTFLNGFGNIGVANFRRNFQFHKDFQFNVLMQIVGVLTTLLLAFLLHSYWALVLGVLARSLVGLILSYTMQSYRPRISLSAHKEMFGFSFWIMVRSIAWFFTGNGDRLILGAFYTSVITGWYAIASTLATMAVFELLHPIGRAIFPGLSVKKSDQEWERQNLKKIFSGTATIAAAAGLGLSALATPAITLIYGEKFADASSLLTVLALSAAIMGYNQPAAQYLIVLGRTRELALISSLEGLLIMSTTYLLASNGADIQTVVNARLMVAMLVVIRLFYMLRVVRVVKWEDIAMVWLRPTLAGLVMFMALWVFQENIHLSTFWIVSLGLVLGIVIYSTTLLTLWYLMKCPQGIEEEIIKRLFVQFKSREN